MATTSVAQVEFLEPSLGSIFPMSVRDGVVVVDRAVVLNKTRVLEAGAILRVCFEPPAENSADVKRKESRGNLENTFSRTPTKVSSRDAEYSAYRAALSERALGTTWTNPDLFRGFFYKVPYDRYYLTFQTSAESEPEFERFFFPLGLFIGERTEGGFEILAVEKNSRGYRADLRAGDQILRVAGAPAVAPLRDFLKQFLQAEREARESDQPLAIFITNADQSEPVERLIRAPMSLKMDPFSDPLSE